MTREELLMMAREAGIEVHPSKQQARIGLDALIGCDSTGKLARFAELVAIRAVDAERDRLCALIKAADDKASEGEYMLDSNDCISVIQGKWNHEQN
jgi:hypothetical protein